MPEPTQDKKPLDIELKPLYKDKKQGLVLVAKEEIVEILKTLKGVQRKLQKKIE